MRRFVLVRESDPSGVSGTGVVAEGVEFSDGLVVLRWLRSPYGLNVYLKMEDTLTVHGHGGASYIEWIDGDGHGQDRMAGLSDRRQERFSGGDCVV